MSVRRDDDCCCCCDYLYWNEKSKVESANQIKAGSRWAGWVAPWPTAWSLGGIISCSRGFLYEPNIVYRHQQHRHDQLVNLVLWHHPPAASSWLVKLPSNVLKVASKLNNHVHTMKLNILIQPCLKINKFSSPRSNTLSSRLGDQSRNKKCYSRVVWEGRDQRKRGKNIFKDSTFSEYDLSTVCSELTKFFIPLRLNWIRYWTWTKIWRPPATSVKRGCPTNFRR